MHDTGTARSYYRLAIDRARRAGHDLLAGYMLGSLAAFEIDGDDPETGLTLIAEARRQVGHPQHRRHGPGWMPSKRWASRQLVGTARLPARCFCGREGRRKRPGSRRATLAVGVSL